MNQNNNNELNENARPVSVQPEEEEMPVLVPDDYDVEDIDYSAQNTLSSVVSAKGEVGEATPYKKPKLKGKEAWDNFMYHHKTTLIVSVVAVVMLAICIIQSIPEKYDYYVNIYADVTLGTIALGEINDQLVAYAEDVDGDERIAINLSAYSRHPTNEPYSHIVAYMFIESEFGGDYNGFLSIVDKDHADFIIENVGPDVFEAYEGYPALIPLKDSELITGPSEGNGNSTELYLVLASVPEKSRDDAKLVARHDAAKAMLGRILEAHPELPKAE